MTVFEFAKTMEKDGERYYRKLSNECPVNGLKKILDELADAEVDHYNVLLNMEQNIPPSALKNDLLSNAKNIFASISNNPINSDSVVPDIDLYRHALEIEIKSRKFYEKNAEVSDDPLHKELFLKIAEQERQHFILMENMIEFLFRPYSWLENAEWHHLDEY
jgi:rubrerythrin